MGFLLDFAAGPPDLATLRARVAERAGRLPSLRYRVAPDDTTLVPVDDLDPEAHVHQLDLPSDQDGGQAGRIMVTHPLPADRPPWDLWLIRHGTGSYRLCFRTDHALRDGTAAAYVTRVLLDDRPEVRHRPRPATPTGARGVGAVLRQAGAVLRSPRLAPAFAAMPTGHQGVLHVDAPLESLRAAGRAHTATVNDVYLAALAWAVRRWYQERTDRGHPPLACTMPMSVRTSQEPMSVGNALVTGRVVLPCQESDVRRALAGLAARNRRLRESGYRHTAYRMLGALPRGLGVRAGLRAADARVVTTVTSNLDFGPVLVHQGVPARGAGMFMALAGGLRCYVALTGYHDTARLTLVHDTSLSDIRGLAEHWLTAVRDLAAG